VSFAGEATFYFVSAPAHRPLPAALGTRAAAETHEIGDAAVASARTLRKYVHEDGIASCELAVGITTLAEGSVWNTMPCHTHERRTEIYLYFGLPAGERVVHLCGRPEETRSLVLADREAVISPPWSVHTGAGTAPYRFVWSTGGENMAYNDMDLVPTGQLR
jgi:4-deoxy-L-threo-5-hexosulose-uronate ketol-isomerase